ncbi:MAG: hypothetical protein A3H88_01370 [Candidatus Blackburnbacteria bacterium RIFCSPLOWO2_02_FULL_44_9]|uniref:Ribbon-helix-helix protein CopG domain-containing protein n=1 Tax=Candidatus Blackburnbacteria bacterium RIFCSPHIGHO2_02_FULL_44_20 TaxID=1797516 RepID=A0A1G1V5P0_9BACT|nr:MAG: hypothetical protein A3D26_00785 [Candidatus Blackburnbacteria bacterium RIFCSPHIGHO2_02_FULL_44_20]OGY11076.1 MAG: hypothetical protein A3E16_04700 [Candidatus Blackburnbacteria bacterium RIFCSPHIGHO2_12_FULL_44_25]OGY13460.1 MAG: hypothetical protein A3A62_03070 [Candidatus Blackburnbacteria bacterium RIFCSPLOWO2_01_FULL_44_43]OGY16639.1 MAG: hypothetical protein A3H88_01370 [Candidatus Blackburnbacteria bacterium RIFCSPLOWO2_02_FULL_44_9]
MTTINISLPTNMYKDVKRAVKVGSYASISEMIRDSLRKTLYKEVTVNGLTPAEEDEILETAATPDDNDEVWETEEDITRGFEKLRKKIKSKSVKNKTKRYIQHPI